MRKFMAVLLSFVMVVSLVGCGRQTEAETPKNIKPDLAWWQEQAKQDYVTVSLHMGHSGMTADITPADVLQLMEKVECGPAADFSLVPAHEDASHSVSLHSKTDENRWITATFYYDFCYVSFADSNTEIAALYWLENSDEIKQFFIDNDYYMPLQQRTDIIGNIHMLFDSRDVQAVNDVAQHTGKDGTVTTITEGGQTEYIRIYNVAPYFGNQYMSHIEVLYSYGDIQKYYNVILTTDENYQPVKSIIYESDAVMTDWTERYTIAGIDYSPWMDRLDAPHYNNFDYWLCAGNSGHAEDSIEWTSAIMNCIHGLELGETVDSRIKDYPRNQIYRISLREDSSYYDETPLLLAFYDDCNYLVVCNCRTDDDHPVSVSICDNHTQAYKVNNPQSVREIFGMDGQYVAPQDYESLEKFAQQTMENTSVEKLNEMSDNDRDIMEGWQFAGNVANFTAESTDHQSIDDGREKFTIGFTAMYKKAVNENHNEHISYNIRMRVYRSGNSWEITSAYIY